MQLCLALKSNSALPPSLPSYRRRRALSIYPRRIYSYPASSSSSLSHPHGLAGDRPSVNRGQRLQFLYLPLFPSSLYPSTTSLDVSLAHPDHLTSISQHFILRSNERQSAIFPGHGTHSSPTFLFTLPIQMHTHNATSTTQASPLCGTRPSSSTASSRGSKATGQPVDIRSSTSGIGHAPQPQDGPTYPGIHPCTSVSITFTTDSLTQVCSPIRPQAGLLLAVSKLPNDAKTNGSPEVEGERGRMYRGRGRLYTFPGSPSSDLNTEYTGSEVSSAHSYPIYKNSLSALAQHCRQLCSC